MWQRRLLNKTPGTTGRLFTDKKSDTSASARTLRASNKTSPDPSVVVALVILTLACALLCSCRSTAEKPSYEGAGLLAPSACCDCCKILLARFCVGS
jgi:hypothetical protein